MHDLREQHALVLGLGDSGLAMARWCTRLGASVSVADTRAAPPQLAALRRELPNARFINAPLDAALLEHGLPTLLLKSPGLAPAAVASLKLAAAQRGLAMDGELSLFAQALSRLQQERAYRPQLLAVTGTNGKTTVTALTGQLVQRAGKTVALAGNIGPTLLDTLAQALARDTLPEVWVLELSSFQLDIDSLPDGLFEPTAAALLNLSQDHLDWHGSMAAYASAKARILGRRALAIVNRDDAQVMALLQAPPAAAPTRKAAPLRAVLSFGDNPPPRPGDYGVETVNGMAWLARAQPLGTEERKRLERAQRTGQAKPDGYELFKQRLMPAEALRIRGRHNALNALAALALAESAGCSLAPMLHGLREYRGEPHRLEPVALLHDVEWFDDSKGTNVGATVAALHGLGLERKLVLILGGEGKGQDFSPLAAPLKRHARAALLIGRDAPIIGAALADCGVPLIHAASMDQAVELAAAQARPGDAVLLSPACASFDMFDNYGHRAAVFRAAVGRLAAAAGVSLEGQA
jgi:UDP-N-acetylmuramoylalanine--D-glutamate ligase